MEYSDLRPVAELLARLSESISRFLEKPTAWHGRRSEQRQAFLDRVRRGVFAALYSFIADRLLSDLCRNGLEVRTRRSAQHPSVRN